MMLSILTWFTNLIPIWFIGLSFDIHISFMGCLFILLLGAVAASIPAAPGFWGAFHYATKRGLIFLGLLGQVEALSYAIVLHASYFFPVIIVGLIMVWLEGYSLGQLRHEAQEHPE